MINRFAKVGFAPKRLVFEVGNSARDAQQVADMDLLDAMADYQEAVEAEVPGNTNSIDDAPISGVQVAGREAMTVLDDIDDEKMPITRYGRNWDRSKEESL